MSSGYSQLDAVLTYRTSMTTRNAAPLHSEIVTIEWVDHIGVEHIEVASPHLLERELFAARAIRRGNRYPKQPNYHGLNWFGATRAHVWHESLFERYAMLSLDMRHDIIALAVQPMRMSFADGGEHFPDFIALHSDYRQTVYDVKPASLVSKKAQRQFDTTAIVCESVGWGYEVFSDADRQLRTNVEWVANFRHPAFDPPPLARQQLMDALEGPLTLRDASACMKHDGWDAGIGGIYHLVWTGVLTLDLTQTLSKSSIIRKTTHHVHA